MMKNTATIPFLHKNSLSPKTLVSESLVENAVESLSMCIAQQQVSALDRRNTKRRFVEFKNVDGTPANGSMLEFF